MAATVLIRRITGATGSQTADDITATNTRANAQDSHEVADVDNPVQKPTSGLNYSYWVSTRLDATVTPAGTIDNIRWFADGANGFGTGITCKGITATAYKQATGSVGDTGDQLNSTNYTTVTGATVDVFSHTSGSPKAISGTISNPSTGQFGDLFVYQIEVDTDVGPGASNQEQFTYRFDET